MKEVTKEALDIYHYWGRVEVAPGRGQIHLHMLGILKDRVYLEKLYRTITIKVKVSMVDKCAREQLDTTADVYIVYNNKNTTHIIMGLHSHQNSMR